MAKIFLDSASLLEIEEILKIGFVSGLTTNPSFLKPEAGRDALIHLQKIISLLNQYEMKLPFCVQVMTKDTRMMIDQAEFLFSELNYKELIIKIPCGWDELKVIKRLVSKGLKTNCTACITPAQVALASSAGSQYISLFLGKARDGGEDSNTLVQRCMNSIVESKDKAKLIVGSLRTVADVETAILGGADIVTVRTLVLKEMIKHPKTSEAMDAFVKDFIPIKK